MGGVRSDAYIYMGISFDKAGNRTSQTTYNYTIGTPGNETATESYNYTGDRLTQVGSMVYQYDAIGNPTTYNGYTLEWNGRKLMEMSMNVGQFLYTFAYNADGIRTVKTNGSTIHHYTLNGSQIVTETWTTKSSSGAETPNHFLVYLYDENGAPVGLQYRNKTYGTYTFDTYYFEKNLQGDIIAIYTESGTKIGSYTYDAWGNCTVSTESGTTTSQKRIVRTLNPFRYRGYYYDTDTGLYYLQSRYYNPKWGRFLNADYAEVMSDNGSLSDKNLFVYCDNNPVMRKDEDGEFWNILIGAAVGFVVGAGVSIVTQAMAGELDFTSGKTWAHIGISALSGTITGGFAASGVPLGGQIIANSVCGMLSSVADTAIDHIAGDTKSFSDYALNALEGGAFGAVAGYFGGSGTATPHLTSAFNRAMSNGNWGYYFTQIGKEAVKAGKRAVPAILIGTTPTLTKSTAKMTRRLIECYG